MNCIFEVSKNGNVEISLTEHSIKDFNISSDFEQSFNLRHNNLISEICIKGLINAESLLVDEEGVLIDREVDSTRKLANWALIPEFEDCYKDVSFKLINNEGKVVQEESIKDMYVVDYKEKFGNGIGVGNFTLLLRRMAKLGEK
ncbi:MAG: hypothetical protein FWE02_06905 [Defluviitaleaceae bacterium]|nr:hypothetical protein [Defluviitaleaceae bacterium]